MQSEIEGCDAPLRLLWRDAWCVLALALVLTATSVARALDTDGDLIDDDVDNCIEVWNGPALLGASQRDTDGDGIGNNCDPDFDQDGLVSARDLDILARAMGTSNPNLDLTGDSLVDGLDFHRLADFWNRAPGPSSLAQPPAIEYIDPPPPPSFADVASDAVHVRYVIDPAETDGAIYGNLVTGLVPGDRIRLHVEVENSAGREIDSLFATTIFDPTLLTYVDGVGFELLVEPGTPPFVPPLGMTVWSNSDSSPNLELRLDRADVVLSLSHVSGSVPGISVPGISRGTRQTGPEIASTIEFEVVTTMGAGTISHRRSAFGCTRVDDAYACPGSSRGEPLVGFGPPVIFAVPEPTPASMVAAGCIALGRWSARRRRS